eukprot:529246-Amphidinium_carterae.2
MATVDTAIKDLFRETLSAVQERQDKQDERCNSMETLVKGVEEQLQVLLQSGPRPTVDCQLNRADSSQSKQERVVSECHCLHVQFAVESPPRPRLQRPNSFERSWRRLDRICKLWKPER